MSRSPQAWPRLIGILGGLGPHAHLIFERRLLAAAGEVSDQEYPAWLLASVPQTPDRTAAILQGGASPVPQMAAGLTRLARGGADFAIIACMTAHVFLPELRARAELPILDLIATTLASLVERHGPRARIGLLATDGTLRSQLFPGVAADIAPELRWLSPLDLEDGAALQEEGVMRPIFGPLRDGRRLGGGIKSGRANDLLHGLAHRDVLAATVERLATAGIDAAVCGCTEVSLALGSDPVAGTPLVDPLAEGARGALDIASGRRPLPGG